jgi:hypothetical protein
LRLVVMLEATWERAADWEECLQASLESPRTLTPHSLASLFPAPGSEGEVLKIDGADSESEASSLRSSRYLQ